MREEESCRLEEKMNNREEKQQILSEKEKALQKEIEKLNHLAEEALEQGGSLSDDQRVLRQSKYTDEMILDIQYLQNMLDEYDREHGE